MGKKRCGQCGAEKPASSFYARKLSVDGLQNNCKTCAKSLSGKWRAENREHERQKSAKAYRRKQGYPEDYVSNYGLGGNPVPGMSAIERNSHLLTAYRNLSAEHKAEVAAIYAKRAKMNAEEGYFKYHVDHIAPIQGVTISGLHVPWNLRIVEGKENSVKNLRYEFEDAWPKKVTKAFLYEVMCRLVDEGMHPRDVTKETWRWPKGRKRSKRKSTG